MPVRAIVGSLVLVALAPVVGLRALRAEPPEYRSHQPQLGPVPTGAALHLAIEGGPEHLLGDNLWAKVELKNEGTEAFDAYYDGFQGPRLMAIRMQATDEAGREVADPMAEQKGFAGNGPGGTRRMAPGESFAFRPRLEQFLRFQAPGTYRVKAWLDAGWTETAERKAPVAEATLTLRRPTPEEARTLVARLLEGAKSTSSPTAFLESLRDPIYLPLLVEQVRAGTLRAFDGLAQIRTPAATRALVDVLAERDGLLLQRALTLLLFRVPRPPAAKPPEGLPPFAHPPARPWTLYPGTWSDDLAAPLRERLRAILESGPSADVCANAADLLECVGTDEDVVALVHYLDLVVPLSTVDDRGRRERSFPPRAEAFDMRAVHALAGFAARRASPPPDPRTPGEILLFLAVAVAPGHARPPDLDARCLAWLEHHAALVRRAALESMSVDSLATILDRFPALAGSGDVGVRIAALQRFLPLAERIQDDAAVGAVRHAGNGALVSVAAKFALAQKRRLQLVEAWIDRLDTTDASYLSGTLRALANLVLTLDARRISGGGGRDVADTATLAKTWTEFVRQHRTEIDAGRTWLPDDPDVSPDLFGGRLTFILTDGTSWPPKPDRKGPSPGPR